MNLIDLVAALRARWRLEVAVALLTLLVVAAWTAATPRRYVATATLLFEDRQVDPVDGERGGQPELDAAALGTQADIVASVATAADVVRRLGLARTPEAQARWRGAGAPGTIEEWTGRSLLANLEVEPARNTNVLAVQYSSSDPELAARLANGFASTFIGTRLRLQTDPAREFARWFEERTRSEREALERAQRRLVDYQRAAGVISVGNADVETARLSQLEVQLADAQAELAAARGRAGSGAAASTDVQTSAVVQGLRSQIATKSAELSELRAVYGPNHPTMRAGQAELATLQAKLGAEIGTGTRSVQVASSAAASRVAQLAGLVAEQRQRVLGLGGDKSQLDMLRRDVESARAAYDNVTTRLSAARLQSELPATNVTQLDQARAPVLPSSPNVPVRVLLGCVLAAMLAVAAAVLAEFLFPRVRTPAGLASITNAPVLGRIDFDRSRIAGLLEDKASAA